MAKPNPLAQGLNQLSRRGAPANTAPVVVETVDSGSRPKRAAAREGRVLVGGFFSPEVQTALKILAAEERTTLQSLLAEAINTVFAKRGRPEIAELSSRQVKS